MTPRDCSYRGAHRRTFLADLGLGFTGLALAALLHRDGRADGTWAPPGGKPHFPPKAKSVIWLFLNGGRGHHISGFSVWLAGGGIKGGVVHGRTDEIGFHAVEDRHYVTDVHATILHLLGLDSRRLEVPGRKRLEIDHGQPIRPTLA